MKTRNLIRHLTRHDCYLHHEGGNHSIFVNRSNRKISTVPRHKEIKNHFGEKNLQGFGYSHPFQFSINHSGLHSQQRSKMKLPAFLLIILVCAWRPSAAQSVASVSGSFERMPFQVLHAEGVQLVGYLRPVAPLDLLFRRDTMVVSEAGHLILVHHSGAFLEFSQDTTVAVSELSVSFSF